VGELPKEVREAYEAEIQRLEQRLGGASDSEAESIRASIADLEEELLIEDWPMVD
jgi:hypothetical protein